MVALAARSPGCPDRAVVPLSSYGMGTQNAGLRDARTGRLYTFRLAKVTLVRGVVCADLRCVRVADGLCLVVIPGNWRVWARPIDGREPAPDDGFDADHLGAAA